MRLCRAEEAFSIIFFTSPYVYKRVSKPSSVSQKMLSSKRNIILYMASKSSADDSSILQLESTIRLRYLFIGTLPRKLSLS